MSKTPIPIDVDCPIIELIKSAAKIARTARRNGKSLSGSSFYALKFSRLAIDAVKILRELEMLMPGDSLKRFSGLVDEWFNVGTSSRRRVELLNEIERSYELEIKPLFPNQKHTPSSQLFPLEIVVGTRVYIERIAMQASGCYDKGWYDACMVMARRLLETLIIEAFEAHGVDSKIKKPDGSFMYLSELIPALLNESKWNIGRNTRGALPNLKNIGDMSAHSRRFTAKKTDVDGVRHNLRVSIEELVYLSKLKK